MFEARHGHRFLTCLNDINTRAFLAPRRIPCLFFI